MSEETDKSLVPLDEQPFTLRTLETLSKLPTVPERYFDKPMEMWAAVLQGRELGVGPMASINNIFLVGGSTSMHAKLMAGLVLEKGHVYAIQASDEMAVIKCQRYHSQLNEMFDVGTFSFSIEDAERASLTTEDKEAWTKYPQMMLTNRALSWAARMVYADCIVGVGHTPDEVNIVETVDDFDVIADGEVVEEEDDDG